MADKNQNKVKADEFSRDELNGQAEKLGLKNAKDYKDKASVVEAINRVKNDHDADADAVDREYAPQGGEAADSKPADAAPATGQDSKEAPLDDSQHDAEDRKKSSADEAGEAGESSKTEEPNDPGKPATPAGALPDSPGLNATPKDYDDLAAAKAEDDTDEDDEFCETCNRTGLVAGAYCPDCHGTPSKKERTKLNKHERKAAEKRVSTSAAEQKTPSDEKPSRAVS